MDDDQIVEGNVVKESAPVIGDQASMVLSLEEMIKSHISSIEKLQEGLDENKSLLDSIFENDSTYKQHDKEAKEAARVKSNTKQQILKQSQAAELNEKVKTMRNEIKNQQEALSDYLREFQRMSGLSEIEDSEGEVREIVYIAKLVKKSSKFN